MTKDEFMSLKARLYARLDRRLVEMKPDTDDSITGFNEAWDEMRDLFDEILSKEILPASGGLGPRQTK